MELTERIEDGGDDVCFLEPMRANLSEAYFSEHLRPRPALDEYELFDQIDLLSIEPITENWLLLLFNDGVGSSSERQCGAEQRLEEHCRRELVLNCTTVFV